jgi:hypothetical protein
VRNEREMRSAEWKSGLSDFHFAIRIRLSPLRLLPTGCDDYSNNDQPGDHEANTRTYPESVEHREQEDKEKPSSPQAGYVSPSTAYRGSSDHHQCNRGKEIFVANLQ